MTLRIRYQTLEFPKVDIHLRSLWDKQQFDDVDEAAEKVGVEPSSWAFSGVIWPSGHVLAHLMGDFPIADKRILEVGCGLGLASLLLNTRHADITATDHNPAAGGFLAQNTQLNASQTIPFIRADWADSDSELGQFDLIIGSDLLYAPGHVELLCGFMHRHARPNCEVLMVEGGRGYHTKFGQALEARGFSGDISRPQDTPYLAKPFKGYVLRYQRNA